MKTGYSARCLMVGTLLAMAAPALADAPKMPTVAVYPAAATGDAAAVVEKQSLDIQEITRQTEEALRATRRFTMFERSAEVMANTVKKEQTLAQSDEALGDAADFGKLNNVGMIVQPLLTIAKMGSSFAGIDEFPGKYKRTDTATIIVTFKVLDTTSGQIKYQSTEEAGFSKGAGVVDSKGGGIGREVWTDLAHDVALKGATSIVDYVFPVQVIKADATGVYLNRGEGGGLTVGQVMDVFAQGEALVDPSTGESLGATETLLGKVKVDRVNPKFSVAKPVGKLSDEPQAGAIVRTAKK